MDHLYSVRPSTILNVYLLLSILLDTLQLPTIWTRHDTFAVIFTISLFSKVILILLEVRDKRSILAPPYQWYTPEATSGVFARRLFLWLTPLFGRGFSSTIRPDDLFGLDDELSSARLHRSILVHWHQC
jgi:ATP-binding cassette subfamily C (CFTR/MRP) protein 1